MKTKILIVDDEQEFRNLIKDGLAGHAEIMEADSGIDALNLVSTFHPDIILLDINLPDINGYSVCLLAREKQPEVRVVFISGSDSLETRQNAYASGADDFLPKPFRMAELRRKIELLQLIITDSERLKDSLKTATDTAMSAISNSGEMGTVINFIKRAMSSPDIESLLKVLISTFSHGFDLNVSAQIRTENEQKTLNSEGRSSPLEAEILRTLSQDNPRIFEYGHRLIVNYPSITLQIKNLPYNNPDFAGRIRDHAAIITETAENRIHAIETHQRLTLQSTNAKTAISNMQELVQQLESDYKIQQSRSCELFENLKQQIENSLAKFGLSNEQETHFIKLIEDASQAAATLYDAGFSLDKKFSSISADLGLLLIKDADKEILETIEDKEDSIIFF
ncbi:response regulator [Iodobacter sp. CM08]|uniref:response regulator transcription factor n=1 Tax=Iodobacter sp. CM08 TaxID=3085902 RepID=UPI0029819B78|nr:response regulator [Iodobacter sp. CM08]MDW5415563.1 response regulator [Iodobacter sp. CM08]